MLKQVLPKSAFAKNVITLMTGTSIAQAIPIAISPILTRLYTPADFGVFALYMAIVSIVSVLVTGRYELAIMLPKKDDDAINIVALSVGLSCVISVVLLLIVSVFNSQITKLLGSPAVSNWLYFIPASTLLTGIYQSLNYWSNRKEHYKRLALSRIVQSTGASMAQLGSGYAAVGGAGLLAGQLFGQAFSTTILARLVWREDQSDLRGVSRQEIKEVARKYKDFPKYMIAGQLANVASGQMPMLLLSALFGPAVAGFYALSQRVLMTPMSLVGAAVGDVFRSEAARSYHLNGNCKKLYIKTATRLLVIAAPPGILILFFGPMLFSFVFGEQWREAGELASILSVMVFFQTISSPLSQTILLAGMQALDLVWQFMRFFLSVVALFAGYKLFNSYRMAIIFYATVFSLMYLLHSFFQYQVAAGLKRL